MPEEEAHRAARARELHNEEVISRILVSGSQDEMRELAAVHRLSSEKMESLRYWARLRFATLVDRDSLVVRDMTPEERQLGVRIEFIEPQVRYAVRVFRHKGYQTTYSGFDALGSAQTLWFTGDKRIRFPQSVQHALETRWGVRLMSEPGKIGFDCLNTRLTLDDLCYIWHEIADALPDISL